MLNPVQKCVYKMICTLAMCGRCDLMLICSLNLSLGFAAILVILTVSAAGVVRLW